MLREYCQKLYEIYQEKGFTPAVKAFGKSFGEYLLVEANHIKSRQIQGGNKPSFYFPHASRMYAEFVTGQSFRKISNQDLEGISSDIETDFLNKVK
ncbi:MAG: hypothetical protein V1802_02050 [Candidatus Aenigmatarchaeota archaeon]